MPVERTFSSPDAVWGWWRIQEDERVLEAQVPGESVSPTLTNPQKRLEFLAGRALIKSLLHQWALPYPGVRKDAFGKPFLQMSEMRISLSHSYPYVAAVLHRHKNVGIDLEQPKPKLLRIAHRVMSPAELADAGDDVIKHCVYWCAKETLVKIYGRKDLVFSENLQIEPFQLATEGQLIGRILAENTETAVRLTYIVSGNFVVVVSN